MAFRWIGKSPERNTVTLKRFEGFQTHDPASRLTSSDTPTDPALRRGVVLDIETTGVEFDRSQIIELGVRAFDFNRESGAVIRIGEAYCSFDDPHTPIPPEITRLTGITDGDVRGQAIDWPTVDRILGEADLIIAHNASFDRPFVDARSSVSQDKHWACSFRYVDWSGHGFPAAKLECLHIWHGFFVDAHRALVDAEGLLHLLSFDRPEQPGTYLLELIENARKQHLRVFAHGSPIESKDLLKMRRYTWDTAQRVWSKQIAEDKKTSEIEWLESNVYRGQFKGTIEAIAAKSQFKRTK